MNELNAAIAKKADLIVVGNPINMNGTEGPRSEKCRAFAAMLQEMASIPVVLYDERLTTLEVQKVMISADVSRNKRKKVVDTLAATLILQSYLDSIR